MLSRRMLAAATLLVLAGYVFVYAAGRAPRPIRSDAFSYYVYLPAWFLYHDPTLDAVARDCCGGQFPSYTAIIRWPGTGRWVNAHPIGVAVMQIPLFAVAHALTRWSNLSPDGFTIYYQHAAGLSGMLAVLAGLWILRSLLRRHFTDPVVAATLATILFATNLYHYATFDSGWSHPYSFLLFGSFLLLTDSWQHARRYRTAALLGLVAGLIVLVRHPNVIFPVVVFVLYGVTDRESLRQRVSTLARDWRHVAVACGVGSIVLMPQVYTYSLATGRPFVSAYGDLGFNFASPRLFGVLFGVEKGLFFWHPVLLLGCAGLVILARSQHAARAFVVPAVLFLLVDTYLVASWWDWQFGGSFGHRGFTDALPLFAIGLAACFEAAARLRISAAVTALVTSCTVLSLYLMALYWFGRVPFQNTTWAEYRALFPW